MEFRKIMNKEAFNISLFVIVMLLLMVIGHVGIIRSAILTLVLQIVFGLAHFYRTKWGLKDL